MICEFSTASVRPLVLTILLDGPSYGYRIRTTIEEISGAEIECSDAMIYTLLQRMERDELISVAGIRVVSGRARKYYRITDFGRSQIAVDRGALDRICRMLEVTAPAPA